MLSLIRNLVVIVALVLGVAFGFYNYDLATIDLLWTSAQVPLVVLLVIAFVLGFAVAALFWVARILRLRGQLSSSRRRLKDARAEISNLRSMPVHKS